MKKFQFKLAPLLNYRTYLERLAQQDTARAHMDVKGCESAIRQLKLNRVRQADEIEESLQKGLHSSQFKRYYEYMDALENQLVDEKKRKTQLKKVLEEKIQILKKKSVDKKAMELYRDRQHTRYQQELLKTEQKELDEISTLKTARKVNHDTSE